MMILVISGCAGWTESGGIRGIVRQQSRLQRSQLIIQELLLFFLRLGYELLLVWLQWIAWAGGHGREWLLGTTHQQRLVRVS